MALDALREQESVAEIARRYQLHVNVVANWKRQLAENVERVFKRASRLVRFLHRPHRPHPPRSQGCLHPRLRVAQGEQLTPRTDPRTSQNGARAEGPPRWLRVVGRDWGQWRPADGHFLIPMMTMKMAATISSNFTYQIGPVIMRSPRRLSPTDRTARVGRSGSAPLRTRRGRYGGTPPQQTRVPGAVWSAWPPVSDGSQYSSVRPKRRVVRNRTSELTNQLVISRLVQLGPVD